MDKSLAQVPGGNPEVAALLAIHGLQNVYSPQADAALQLTLPRLYTQRVFGPTMRTGPLYSIAISPDGKTVFTSDLVLRDIETGNITNYLVTNDDPDPWGTHVAFSPDGRWALAGIYLDHTARMWDVQTGKALQVFSGHTDRVLEGAFSPDGKWVITGSADKTARVWDVTTGKEVREFVGHTDQVQTVAFSPDGKQVLTGSSAAKTAWLWDAETGELLRKFKGHAGAIRSVVFSSDGKRILTASDDMTARLWDAETGELLRVFGGHTDGVGKAVFAPDGRSVLTASWDGTIRQWNLGSDERVFALPVLTSSSLFASGGDSILLEGYEGKVAWLTDARTGRELTRFSGHTDKISSVEVSKDKKYVLTGSYDKTARLWNAATGQELRIFRGHTDFVNANFSEDGKFVLTWGRDKTVRVWAAATGQELRVFQFKSATDMPTAVAISPDNTSVLVNVPDDPIFTMWDIGSGLPRYWDTLTPNRAVVFSLSFSPDGRYILSAANDGKVQVWEWKVGMSAPIQTFSHPDAVNFASYSPDGKFIWTGCADGKVRQWDATTGQLVRVFSGPRGYSQVDDISPDGKFVLIEYDDQSVHLYDVDYHDTIRYVCSRLLRDLTSAERAVYNIKDTKPTCPQP